MQHPPCARPEPTVALALSRTCRCVRFEHTDSCYACTHWHVNMFGARDIQYTQRSRPNTMSERQVRHTTMLRTKVCMRWCLHLIQKWFQAAPCLCRTLPRNDYMLNDKMRAFLNLGWLVSWPNGQRNVQSTLLFSAVWDLTLPVKMMNLKCPEERLAIV